MKRIILTLSCILFYVAVIAQNKTETSAGKPFVLGRTVELHSEQLTENRKLNIYLPEGYNPRDTVRYPVIYLLDGGADEDFIHVVGLVQFNSFPWINRLPPSIVVGIANTDRKRDMTYPSTIKSDTKILPTAGGSEKFIAFLQKDLQPYIQKNYKTNTSKTLIGESLAGLLATEVLLKQPTLFSKYIIISPSLWWDNASLLNVNSIMLNADFTQATQIYIGVGKEGLGPSQTPHVMEVDANLLAEKLKATKSKSVKVFFDYLPQENHATIGHQAVFNAFKVIGK